MAITMIDLRVLRHNEPPAQPGRYPIPRDRPIAGGFATLTFHVQRERAKTVERPPPPTAARLTGLPSETVKQILAAAQALEMGYAGQAESLLLPAISTNPDHPEVLRLRAWILSLGGHHTQAIEMIRRAASNRRLDALYQNTLGSVLGASGDFDGAVAALTKACELQPTLGAAWYNLGIMLTRSIRHEDAIAALQRAVSLSPNNADARAQLADLLRIQGLVDEAATEYRRVLASRPSTGAAWWGLAELRTNELTEADVQLMSTILRNRRVSIDDRIAVGFAAAKALDETGKYADSLNTIALANAVARERQRWNSSKFSRYVERILQTSGSVQASTDQLEFGGEVLFIVGMPRSGTTLVEQILASHSQVEGTGELHDLPQILNDESSRRGAPFPVWVPDAQPADWRRMGEQYLKRTARWRTRRRRFTDKFPSNWTSIGVIRAMLPGAHIVVCRRDPLETCFSCYRQHLAGNEYSRTFSDLADFWRDFDRAANHFATLHAMHVYQHHYESLIANADDAIRELLSACGLPFESSCLQFHSTKRPIRSPSATQVRRPLQQNTARAGLYGSLLDPLRKSLGLS